MTGTLAATARTVDAETVYRALLEVPGDEVTMLALADALEENGQDSLAHAYRWAAERGRWPLRRRARKLRSADVPMSDGSVYDWQPEWSSQPDGVPAHAVLPKRLTGAIMSRNDRRYGDLNQAFMLLADALMRTNQ